MKNKFKLLMVLAVGMIQMSSMTMGMVTATGQTAFRAAGAMLPALYPGYQNSVGQGISSSIGNASDVAAARNGLSRAPMMYRSDFADMTRNLNGVGMQRRPFSTSASDSTDSKNVTFDQLKASYPILPKEIFEAGPVEKVQKIEKDDSSRIIRGMDYFRGPNNESIRVSIWDGSVYEQFYVDRFGWVQRKFNAQGELLSVDQYPSDLTHIFYNADGTINKISLTDADQKERKEYYSTGGLVKTFGPSIQYPDLLTHLINSSSDYQGWDEIV